jgi:hypothetical protein
MRITSEFSESRVGAAARRRADLARPSCRGGSSGVALRRKMIQPAAGSLRGANLRKEVGPGQHGATRMIARYRPLTAGAAREQSRFIVLSRGRGKLPMCSAEE